MKFEVTEREEIKTGLIFKKSTYYCKINLDFTDQEMEALEKLCENKDYRKDIMGEVMVKRGFDPRPLLLGDIVAGAKNNGGIFSYPVRHQTPEEREFAADQIREAGLEIKHRLDTTGMMAAVAKEDTVEEL